jgi:hypothetical protein
MAAVVYAVAILFFKYSAARNDRALKLHTKAVQKILQDGIDAAAAQPVYVPAATKAREGRIRVDISVRKNSSQTCTGSVVPARPMSFCCFNI